MYQDRFSVWTADPLGTDPLGPSGYSKCPPPTAHATIRRLQDLGILREITGRDRYRQYVADEVLDAVY